MANDTLRKISAINDEIMTLGAQIEQKRKDALALAYGMVAVDRHDRAFRVLATKVTPGSYRLFLDGPILKADGSDHLRNRNSSTSSLLKDLKSLKGDRPHD